MLPAGVCDPRSDVRVAGWAASVRDGNGARTHEAGSLSHAGFIPAAVLFFVLRQSPTDRLAV